MQDAEPRIQLEGRRRHPPRRPWGLLPPWLSATLPKSIRRKEGTFDEVVIAVWRRPPRVSVL